MMQMPQVKAGSADKSRAALEYEAKYRFGKDQRVWDG